MNKSYKQEIDLWLALAEVKRTGLRKLIRTSKPLLEYQFEDSEFATLESTVLRSLRKCHTVAHNVMVLSSSHENYDSMLSLGRIVVEEAVSVAYLRKHPNKLDQFLSFLPVQMYRDLASMKGVDPNLATKKAREVAK